MKKIVILDKELGKIEPFDRTIENDEKIDKKVEQVIVVENEVDSTEK